MKKSTADRILDTAERLFAKEGYHFTSLRKITSEAGVNLGSVNYHFTSKQGLMEAVLTRRIVPLNEIRMQMLEDILEAARHAGQPPRSRDILRALLEPALRLCGANKDSKHFVTFVGRIMYESDETVRVAFLNMMTPMFHSFFQAMRQALPYLPGAVLFHRLLFVIGVMGHTLCLGDKIQLPPISSPAWDTQTMLDQLLTFAEAGMEAPCPA